MNQRLKNFSNSTTSSSFYSVQLAIACANLAIDSRITQRNDKLGGALFFSAGTQFLIINTIAESVYPNYSVRLNFLSDLGVGQQTALMWNASLLLLGVLVILGSYYLFRGTGRQKFLVPFLLAGLGPIVVAIFNENTIIAVHAIGAYTSFIFGGVSAILTYRLTRTPFRYFPAVLGVITLVAIVLFTAGQYLGMGVGGMERMIVYPELISLVSFGAYLLSSN